MPLTRIVPIPEPPPIEYKPEDRRLWIGNIDTRLSEYHLLKILQKHGQMEKFDLLFHRSGPLAGQPRGYAFVTYSTNQEAQRMKEVMNGKKIGTKNIAVRWAHNINVEEREKQKVELDIPALAGAKEEQKNSRTTTIQAIEEKLKMMESSSSNEFKLNDGVPGINFYHLQRNVSKGNVSNSHKSKPYSRAFHRR